MGSIVLVHHADAVGPEVDPERPLSALGRTQAESLAERAAAAGLRPSVIWHSGKLRARQTAEYYWRACNPLADFKMARGLRPDDDPAWMRDALYGEERDVMLVSHMPLLPALTRALLSQSAGFPLNGFLVVERVGDRHYVERYRALPAGA